MVLKNKKNIFYKKISKDKIYWIDNDGIIGELWFSFDKNKIYNLFKDYPKNLTLEEKQIFDKENPYWKSYFEKRH